MKMIAVIISLVLLIGILGFGFLWPRHVSGGTRIHLGSIDLSKVGEQIICEMPNINRHSNIVLVTHGNTFDGYSPCEMINYNGEITVNYAGEILKYKELMATNWFDPNKSCVLKSKKILKPIGGRLELVVSIDDSRYGIVDVILDPVNK